MTVPITHELTIHEELICDLDEMLIKSDAVALKVEQDWTRTIEVYEAQIKFHVMRWRVWRGGNSQSGGALSGRGPRKNSSLLFISPLKPLGHVTPSTISGWIKTVLRLAGIDPKFTAHSTRGAASSKATKRGISLYSILKTGSWAHETTFTRFYRREIHPPVIEETILNCELWSHM